MTERNFCQVAWIVSSPLLIQSEVLVNFGVPLLDASGLQADFRVGVMLSMRQGREVLIYMNGTVEGGLIHQASISCVPLMISMHPQVCIS